MEQLFRTNQPAKCKVCIFCFSKQEHWYTKGCSGRPATGALEFRLKYLRKTAGEKVKEEKNMKVDDTSNKEEEQQEEEEEEETVVKGMST